jgi:hypothetical protein
MMPIGPFPQAVFKLLGPNHSESNLELTPLSAAHAPDGLK